MGNSFEGKFVDGAGEEAEPDGGRQGNSDLATTVLTRKFATGVSPMTFSPNNGLTRAQLITFLYRYSNRSAAARGTTITVPTNAPDGGCASEVPKGIYQWERCAWFDYRENPTYHYALSDTEARALIQQIWDDETQDAYTERNTVHGHWFEAIDNKGAFMPSALIGRFVELALTHDFVYLSVEQFDGTEFGGFNFGLSGAGSHIQAVVDECGGTPPPWNELRNDNNEYVVYVEAARHDRTSPYDNTVPSLNAVCRRDGAVDIFLWLEAGYLAGQYRLDNRIPVTYVIFPYDWVNWDQQRRQSHFNAHAVDTLWHESTPNESAFLPASGIEAFVNSATNPGELLMIVEDFDGDEFGRFLFDTHGLDGSLRAVTRQCGWKWTDD